MTNSSSPSSPSTMRPNSAARNFGDFFRRGESRLQDQIQRLRFGEAGWLFGFQQSLGQGALADFTRINTGPVIGDLDHHLVSLVISAQAQYALRPLARANALFGGLDAVANRVSDQMGERLGNRIQDGFVEIGLPTPNNQLNFFPALPPDIPHDARQPAQQLIDRHHANLPDGVLQILQDPPLECHGIRELSPPNIPW